MDKVKKKWSVKFSSSPKIDAEKANLFLTRYWDIYASVKPLLPPNVHIPPAAAFADYFELDRPSEEDGKDSDVYRKDAVLLRQRAIILHGYVTKVAMILDEKSNPCEPFAPFSVAKRDWSDKVISPLKEFFKADFSPIWEQYDRTYKESEPFKKWHNAMDKVEDELIIHGSDVARLPEARRLPFESLYTAIDDFKSKYEALECAVLEARPINELDGSTSDEMRTIASALYHEVSRIQKMSNALDKSLQNTEVTGEEMISSDRLCDVCLSHYVDLGDGQRNVLKTTGFGFIKQKHDDTALAQESLQCLKAAIGDAHKPLMDTTITQQLQAHLMTCCC